MWFRFPQGSTEIQVEQQTFKSEFQAKDKDDNKIYDFFRAPDHFAPRILMHSAFRAETPDGAPDDLPKSDPQFSAEVAAQSLELQGLRTSMQNAQQDLTVAGARLTALKTENEALVKKVGKLDEENEKLTDDIEGFKTTIASQEAEIAQLKEQLASKAA